MTLMSVDNYKENKWKNGHGGGVLDKPKPILSLSNSILLLAAIVSIVVLKFMVVLSEYLFFSAEIVGRTIEVPKINFIDCI